MLGFCSDFVEASDFIWFWEELDFTCGSLCFHWNWFLKNFLDKLGSFDPTLPCSILLRTLSERGTANSGNPNKSANENPPQGLKGSSLVMLLPFIGQTALGHHLETLGCLF